jgi:hypothetical protein
MSCSTCGGSKGTLRWKTQGESASIGSNAQVDLLRTSSCTGPVLYGLMLTQHIKMCDLVLHCYILMNIFTALVSRRELTTYDIISERCCGVRVGSTDASTRKLDTSFTFVDEINFSLFTIFQNLSVWKLQYMEGCNEVKITHLGSILLIFLAQNCHHHMCMFQNTEDQNKYGVIIFC